MGYELFSLISLISPLPIPPHQLFCSINRQLWQYGKKLESSLLPLEVDRKLKAVDPFSTRRSRIRLHVASVSVRVTVPYLTLFSLRGCGNNFEF
jgi:hypothetical protein